MTMVVHILTDALADIPSDRAVIDAYVELARTRGVRFVPVIHASAHPGLAIIELDITALDPEAAAAAIERQLPR